MNTKLNISHWWPVPGQEPMDMSIGVFSSEHQEALLYNEAYWSLAQVTREVVDSAPWSSSEAAWTWSWTTVLVVLAGAGFGPDRPGAHSDLNYSVIVCFRYLLSAQSSAPY